MSDPRNLLQPRIGRWQANAARSAGGVFWWGSSSASCHST